MTMPKEEATVLEYLKWFWQEADFGPADMDVRAALDERFKQETGKAIPKAYSYDA